VLNVRSLALYFPPCAPFTTAEEYYQLVRSLTVTSSALHKEDVEIHPVLATRFHIDRAAARSASWPM